MINVTKCAGEATEFKSANDAMTTLWQLSRGSTGATHSRVANYRDHSIEIFEYRERNGASSWVFVGYYTEMENPQWAAA